MKRMFFYSLMSLLVYMFTACSSEKNTSSNDVFYLDHIGFTISQSGYEYGTNGETIKIRVTSSSPWKVEGVPSWLILSPMSGKGGIKDSWENIIKITATPNKQDEDRAGYFQVVAGENSQTVHFVQYGIDDMFQNYDLYNLETFSVQTNRAKAKSKEQMKIYVSGGSPIQITWGDGEVTRKMDGYTGFLFHTYPDQGSYKLHIIAGAVSLFRFENEGMSDFISSTFQGEKYTIDAKDIFVVR